MEGPETLLSRFCSAHSSTFTNYMSAESANSAGVTVWVAHLVQVPRSDRLTALHGRPFPRFPIHTSQLIRARQRQMCNASLFAQQSHIRKFPTSSIYHQPLPVITPPIEQVAKHSHDPILYSVLFLEYITQPMPAPTERLHFRHIRHGAGFRNEHPIRLGRHQFLSISPHSTSLHSLPLITHLALNPLDPDPPIPRLIPLLLTRLFIFNPPHNSLNLIHHRQRRLVLFQTRISIG